MSCHNFLFVKRGTFFQVPGKNLLSSRIAYTMRDTCHDHHIHGDLITLIISVKNICKFNKYKFCIFSSLCIIAKVFYKYRYNNTIYIYKTITHPVNIVTIIYLQLRYAAISDFQNSEHSCLRIQHDHVLQDVTVPLKCNSFNDRKHFTLDSVKQ